jgi:leucyl aminopeptidase
MSKAFGAAVRPAVSLLLCLCVLSPSAAQAKGPPSRDVFVTVGEDATASVLALVAREEGAGAARQVDGRQGVSVVRLPERALEALARHMHERYQRCPGFVAHEDLDDALASLHDPSAILATEAALVAYSLDNATTVNALIGQLAASNILNTIRSLSGNATRAYTSSGGTAAANWLRQTWAGYASGRSDVSVQLHPHAGWSQPSVVATITGATLPSEIVVIGGHLDSINSSGSTAPGADDDASGIASLTEAFRAAMATGYRPARTLKFYAYAAEEVGLRGSKEIATAHRNAGANVVGVLQLDMTNYKGSSVDIGLMNDYTNAAQNTFVGQLITRYTGATWQSSTCGYGCSDHASWTSAGYPSSMPFEALMGQHNPRIHTANDTLANTDTTGAHALKFARLAAAFMGELAKGTTGTPPPPPPPPAGVVTASYDATLRAPACATVGGGCDSGSLLNGRGPLGPEGNAPNTVGGACADGASGTYHADESNDRIRVLTTDGTPLAAGKTVRVEATVWAYSGYTSDRLDLYRSPSATSPTWTLIGTLTPGGAGARTLSATYTLPAGSRQVVRARFRYQGSASPCAAGSYIDHDDLVFAVGP